MKNTMASVDRKSEISREDISEVKAIETIQNETQREKRKKE